MFLKTGFALSEGLLFSFSFFFLFFLQKKTFFFLQKKDILRIILDFLKLHFLVFLFFWRNFLFVTQSFCKSSHSKKTSRKEIAECACVSLRCYEVIQISLEMLSRRANEIHNARKEQKHFQTIKNFSVKKEKLYRNMGVKLIFTKAHISLMVAFERPNVTTPFLQS